MGFFLHSNFLHVLYVCDLTWSSRQELSRRMAKRPRIPTINHAVCAFIENKRYRAKAHRPRDVVNQNGPSVYQTDQVFVVYSPRADAHRICAS
jgi:hypothetical protein